MVEKVKTTWLQCVVPQDVWDEINKRRQALNLRWHEVILPATLEYLDKLEANPPPPEPTVEAKQPKAKPVKKAHKPKAKKKAVKAGVAGEQEPTDTELKAIEAEAEPSKKD